ncbi:hypothetical protein N185_15915 [Sinorhizobium sp. GW3]|nr:hypothetical protein N185_15915 [Sinorhizobium sp. GW3]
MFGFDYAPYGWALCNGTIIPIRQNTALFSLLGTTYGGDGKTTFQLPNFTGRASSSRGMGPGLSDRQIGETFGQNGVTLGTQEMAAHSHALTLYDQSDAAKRASSPSAGNGLTVPVNSPIWVKDVQPDAQFAPTMIGAAGNGQAHENRQPFLAVNFSIALQGVFPAFP